MAKQPITATQALLLAHLSAPVEPMGDPQWYAYLDSIKAASQQRKTDRKREQRRARGPMQRAKRRLCPSKTIRHNVGARINQCLKGVKADKGLFSRLQYSLADLMAHLEAQFQPGMTWENYGQWHVDHVKPCALFDFTDAQQFNQCWALSNLQPLWALDNLIKGARYAHA